MIFFKQKSLAIKTLNIMLASITKDFVHYFNSVGNSG